jgi:hypothetical protein
MPTKDEIIIAQTQRIEAQAIRIAELEARITEFEIERHPWKRGLPTDDQLRKLLALVRTAHPRFTSDDPDFFDCFRSAFIWLANVRRTEKPNTKYYLTHWSDTAEGWLTRRGIPKADPSRALLAAVIAHGDIPFVLPVPADGVVGAIGVSSDETIGRSPNEAWRDVLTGKRPLRRADAAPPLPSEVRAPTQLLVNGRSYTDYAVGQSRE